LSRRAATPFVLSLVLGLAALAPAREAKADDLGGIALLTVAVAVAFGWDVGFTAYNGGHVIGHTEPDSGWMIAETAVTSPQAAVGNIPIVVGELVEDKSDGAIIGTVFLPLAVWANQMTTFSAWSLADKTAPVAPRYGVSWLIGANLSLTTGMVTSFFAKEHFSRPWLAIPETAVGGIECASTIYAAVRDKTFRGQWIALSAWSGTLAVHGIASLIASAASRPEATPDYPTPFEPPVLPPPTRRTQPLEVPTGPGTPPVPRPPPPTATFTPPVLFPSPISDGEQVVPGVRLVGRF